VNNIPFPIPIARPIKNVFYQRATMFVAVVLVEKTLTTFTGKNPPSGNPVKITSSPPAVNTRRSPPVPTYKTQPLLPLPFWFEMLGMSTVSLKVTAAALPTCL